MGRAVEKHIKKSVIPIVAIRASIAVESGPLKGLCATGKRRRLLAGFAGHKPQDSSQNKPGPRLQRGMGAFRSSIAHWPDFFVI